MNCSRLDSDSQLCISFLSIPIPFEIVWALFCQAFLIWFALFWGGFLCGGMYKGEWISYIKSLLLIVFYFFLFSG